MTSSPTPHLRTWITASPTDQHRGLLGYISVRYGDLILDGITVRRTAEGRTTLSFPTRTDRAGRRHAYVRPMDNQARRDIEAAVLGEVTAQGHGQGDVPR